jgi:hypothetical protein
LSAACARADRELFWDYSRRLAVKAAFGTVFHGPDVEATQYGMAKWNKPVRLQLYS